MNLSIGRQFVSLASYAADAVWWWRLAALCGAAALGCRPFASGAASAANAPMPLVTGELVATDSGPIDSTELGFVLPVEIHGRVFRMFVDHGSTGTLLTDSTFERLGLPHWYATATRIDTVVKRGGITPRRDSTASVTIFRNDSLYEYWGDFEPYVLDSLRFARTLQDSVLILHEVAAITLSPFDGLVGRDLLSQFDLEFDMPGHTLRIYPRSMSGTARQRPALPPGMNARDCVRASVIPHGGVDTTQLDSADKADFRAKAAKRFLDEEELRLPLVVNGRPFAGMFDSGSGPTIMNWAAARALGLDRTTAGVRPISTGRLNTFSFRHDQSEIRADTETNYSATGVTFRIADRTLPADSVIISDPTFGDFPDSRTQPLILVGLRHFRDLVLVLAYSTRSVCIRRP